MKSFYLHNYYPFFICLEKKYVRFSPPATNLPLPPDFHGRSSSPSLKSTGGQDEVWNEAEKHRALWGEAKWKSDVFNGKLERELWVLCLVYGGDFEEEWDLNLVLETHRSSLLTLSWLPWFCSYTFLWIISVT